MDMGSNIDTNNVTNTRNRIQDDLVKVTNACLFPNQQMWTCFCQSLYETFDAGIRDLMVVKGGSVIDSYTGFYRPTDFDVEIANTDIFNKMHRFLLNYSNDYRKQPLLLEQHNDYTQTPLGDLNLVCNFINEQISPYSNEIIQEIKDHMYKILVNDTELIYYAGEKHGKSFQISQKAISQLTLGKMNIKIVCREGQWYDFILIRICKRVEIDITTPSTILTDYYSHLRMPLVDIVIKNSCNSPPPTILFDYFRQYSLEYCLIDSLRTLNNSDRTNKLEQRLKRLKQLMNVVLSKHPEIFWALIRKVIDCSMNVINPYQVVATKTLIGRSPDNTTIDTDSNLANDVMLGFVEMLTLKDLQVLFTFNIDMNEQNFDEQLSKTKQCICEIIFQCFRVIA